MKFTNEAPKIDTATYIKPGVNKDALGDLAKNIATTGELAYSNYQVGSLRDEINKEVKTYEDARVAQVEGQEAINQAGGAAMAIDELWQSDSMMGETDIKQVNALEKSYQSNLQKFQAARDQGKISEEELVARINKTTREYVNRNPWMEQDLFAAAQAHLKNTGVADILKYRQDLAQAASKEQRDDYKAIFNHLLKENVPGTRPGMGMDEMMNNLLAHQKQAYTAELWKNYDVVKTGKTKAQMDAMLPGLYRYGIYAVVNDKNKTWAGQLSQITNPSDITSYIAIMEQDAQNEVMLMRSRLAEQGVLHTQEAKDAVSNFERDLQSSIKSLVGVADGKKAAEILTNRATAQETIQRIGVMDQINVAAVNVFKDIAGLLPPSVQMRLMEKFGLDKSTENALKLLDKTYAGTPSNQNMIKSGGANELFGGILQAGAQNPNNPSFINATKMLVTNLNAAYKAGQMTPDEQHMSINTTLAHLAKNQKFFAVQSPDSEIISQVKPQVDFHMQKYAPSLFTAAAGILKDNPGVQITYDVTPTGGLVVYSNDSDVASALNTRFVSQVNNALDAWANVNGMTREKAAPLFYQEYFGSLVGGTDLANDPDIGGSGKNPERPKDKGVSTQPLSSKTIPTETPLEGTEISGGYNTANLRKQEVLSQELNLEQKELQTAKNRIKMNEDAIRIAKERKDYKPEYLGFLEKDLKTAQEAVIRHERNMKLIEQQLKTK